MKPRGPQGVLLGSNPPFSVTLLNPEGNRGGTGKGIKLWMERFNVNSVRGLGLRGLGFSGSVFSEGSFIVISDLAEGIRSEIRGTNA